MGVKREECDRRVKEIAMDLDIYPCLTRKPKSLSIGRQQRDSLAKALIKNPSVCLFDEPLSHVDARNREEIRLLIRELLKEHKTTAVYVTHDLREALALADDLIVLKEGKMEIQRDPRFVLDSNDPVVETLWEGSEMYGSH